MDSTDPHNKIITKAVAFAWERTPKNLPAAGLVSPGRFSLLLASLGP